MKLTNKALNVLYKDIKENQDYNLQDLFKIRDALIVLQGYGLADLNLVLEVMKFINEKNT